MAPKARASSGVKAKQSTRGDTPANNSAKSGDTARVSKKKKASPTKGNRPKTEVKPEETDGTGALEKADKGPEKRPDHKVKASAGPSDQRGGGEYAAFVSHCKVDAAMEARFLQMELEAKLGRPCFLDSDDLRDLTELQQQVRNSDTLIFVQSPSVLERPHCILELVTACENGMPIVGVKLEGSAYDFAHAATFLTHLETTLEQANPGAGKMLEALGVDLTDAAYQLANTIPQIISIGLNRGASRAMLVATITDVADAMRAAKRPALPDRAKWLTARASLVSVSGHQHAGGPSVPHRHVGQALTAVPSEVPVLPDSFLGRPELTEALKHRVLRTDASATTVTAPAKRGASNATAAAGMGGVGKTLTAAALVRDDEVRAAFHKICWVSVGQQPDTAALQSTLYKQLVMKPLPETAKDDMQLALQELKHAARDVSVLLVLDDVWDASQATPLNFVDGSATRSAVVITTRIRSLLDGAAEVKCGTLSTEASLELLLRAGGCEHRLKAPPPAALEAVELCGRLPLALGIAGGIIEELGSAWQSELIPLLKDDFGGEAESVEERVVTASLRALPEAMRAGVEALFTLFAIFAEDAVVPTYAVDIFALMMRLPGSVVPHKRQVCQWLKQLLKANILRGSIDDGVSVHDLVRDCMIRRAEAARKGGLRATQREAVPLLLAAFEAGGPAAGYVSASLHWHVRQAQQPNAAIRTDAVLMRVLTHESGNVRKQGALGIGVSKLLAAADACDSGGKHLEAAELMWAASTVRGNAAGAELQRAWASIKLLETAGRGSSASRALESRVLNELYMASEGSFAFESVEHNKLIERARVLARWASAQGMATASKEAFDAELGLVFAEASTAWGLENHTGYFGPMTRDKVIRAYALWCDVEAHCLKAEAAAPDAASAMGARGYDAYSTVFLPRQHASPEFSPAAAFGKGGARLRETIER